MNVVFSTTRQWNPGDEFILFGCINALRAAGLEFNPVVFNRNPQTRRMRHGWLSRVDRAVFGGRLAPFLDNSFKDDTDPSLVDLVVFAGSPEWRGRRLKPLYRLIDERKVPALFLGIGTAGDLAFTREHFTELEMRVLRSARLIACRDERTAAGLASVGARHLTCPSILSCANDSVRATVRRVGLIFGSDRAVRHNRVSPSTYRYIESLYRTLVNQFGAQAEFELVAHYIDELQHARTAFPGLPLRYSFDSADYRDIYGRYDIVIGHRIHGVGVSASQGIPGMCIVHDGRGDTARGFLAEMIRVGQDIGEVVGAFQRLRANVAEQSGRIIAHKREVAEVYRGALCEVLAGAPFAP